MPERPPREPADLTPLFRVGFCLLALLVPVALCLLLPSVVVHGHGRSNSARCANNLRQLGLAAIQYADDKRFFPHVNRIRELDGDYDSNHAPRVVRALMSYGYTDTPEAWICPSSYDLAYPISDPAVRSDLRAWSWEGGSRDLSRSPFASDSFDPVLRQTSELSYGWTRKGYNSSVRSVTKIGADRAVRTPDSDSGSAQAGEIGNHGHGLNVLFADSTVQFMGTQQPLDARAFEGIETLSLYQQSLRVDPAKSDTGSTLRTARTLGVPILGFGILFVGMGWCYHKGWRQRVRPTPGGRKAWLTADVDGVGKAALGTEARVNAEGKPTVTLSPNQRCPFCHDRLAEADDLVGCVSCQTLLHRECVQEGGTCSTLGCSNRR